MLRHRIIFHLTAIFVVFDVFKPIKRAWTTFATLSVLVASCGYAIAQEQAREGGQPSVVHVRTDVIEVSISEQGGDIVEAKLLAFPASAKATKESFTLLKRDARHTHFASAGFFDPTFSGIPSHLAPYNLPNKDVVLGDGLSAVDVELVAQNSPVDVIKRYSFKRGSYFVGVTYLIHNRTSIVLKPTAYFRLTRDAKRLDGDVIIGSAYTGGAVYTHQDGYNKVSFSNILKGGGGIFPCM
jgi:YidC/Oxa1 family membrane protein insertase